MRVKKVKEVREVEEPIPMPQIEPAREPAQPVREAEPVPVREWQ